MRFTLSRLTSASFWRSERCGSRRHWRRSRPRDGAGHDHGRASWPRRSPMPASSSPDGAPKHDQLPRQLSDYRHTAGQFSVQVRRIGYKTLTAA